MICQSLSPTDHYHNEIFNKKLYQKIHTEFELKNDHSWNEPTRAAYRAVLESNLKSNPETKPEI